MLRKYWQQLPKALKFAVITGLLIVLLLLLRQKSQARSLTNRQLSKDFTLAEFAVTNTGLENVPDSASIRNIEKAVKTFFQPLRDHIGKEVIINSGYRSKAVNAAVGGVKTSKHLTGRAFDIAVIGETGNWIKDQLFKYDLIYLLDYVEAHSSYLHIEF